MINVVDEYLERLRHWFSGSSCFVCRGAAVTGLCDACRQSLPWLGAACARCAVPLPGTPTGALCGDCQNHPPTFDATIAASTYAPPIDQMIHGLKYGRQLAHARLLADLLWEPLKQVESSPIDRLIPMPLHRARLRSRGPNQALEIARPLARRMGIRLDYRIVTRTRNTPPQVELSREERRRNVRDAFAVTGDLTGESIAVFDDVLTSGETARSLAKALREAGAARISNWICARVTTSRR